MGRHIHGAGRLIPHGAWCRLFMAHSHMEPVGSFTWSRVGHSHGAGRWSGFHYGACRLIPWFCTFMEPVGSFTFDVVLARSYSPKEERAN